MLKISVITPSLNQGRFIVKTIESVLNQNYPNFEHIIIDAGSKDDTLLILKKYPHLKWISEPDKGPADAINKGFNLANGEIFCWINADDYYESDIFYEVVDIFSTDDKTELLFGNLTFINEEGSIISRDKTYRFDKDYLLNICADVVRQPCSFFKSSLLKLVNGLNICTKMAFDYELFIKMLEYTQPKFVNKNYAYFRDYSTNLTHSNIRKQAMEIFKISRFNGGKLFSPLNLTNIKKYLFPINYTKNKYSV